jgi:hypothetical protein
MRALTLSCGLAALLALPSAFAQTPLRDFEFLGCAGDANGEPTRVERITKRDAVTFLIQHEQTCGLDVGDKPTFARVGDNLTLDYALHSSDDSVVMCDCLYTAKFTFDASMMDVRTVDFQGAHVAVRPPAPVVKPETKALIARVHAAAVARDFAALESMMDPNFVSSFGGDGGIADALATWREHPGQLDTLAQVTQSADRCAAYSDETVECPANAGIAWRAGFRTSPAGWRLSYFVAGD